MNVISAAACLFVIKLSDFVSPLKTKVPLVSPVALAIFLLPGSNMAAIVFR